MGGQAPTPILESTKAPPRPADGQLPGHPGGVPPPDPGGARGASAAGGRRHVGAGPARCGRPGAAGLRPSLVDAGGGGGRAFIGLGSLLGNAGRGLGKAGHAALGVHEAPEASAEVAGPAPPRPLR